MLDLKAITVSIPLSSASVSVFPNDQVGESSNFSDKDSMNTSDSKDLSQSNRQLNMNLNNQNVESGCLMTNLDTVSNE